MEEVADCQKKKKKEEERKKSEERNKLGETPNLKKWTKYKTLSFDSVRNRKIRIWVTLDSDDIK